MGAARISSISILASLSLLLAAGAASAQSNTITIKQTGTGNTLSVDQSNASNSSVGGLTFSQGSSATYKDGDSGVTAEVNPLVVDSTDETAIQNGVGNDADIIISDSDGSVGTNGRVYLNQSNTVANALGSGPLLGNSATIGLSADGAIAVLGQRGLRNDATINVNGVSGKGTILQQGNDNTAGLRVDNDNAEGFISQKGNGNNTGTVTVGGDNASVTYIQQGNNLSPVNVNEGVSVTTNAGAITITQTTLTGGN